MKTCEVCGSPIRTGYKYCYRHRNYASHDWGGYTSPNTRRRYYQKEGVGLIYFGLIFLFLGIIILGMVSFPDNLVGIIFLLFGGWIFYLGIRTSADVEKIVHKENIRGREQRKEWTQEAKNQVGSYKNYSSASKPQTKKQHGLLWHLFWIYILIIAFVSLWGFKFDWSIDKQTNISIVLLVIISAFIFVIRWLRRNKRR